MTLAQSAEPIGSDGLPQTWCVLLPGNVGQWMDATDVLDGLVCFRYCPPGTYLELVVGGQVCPIEGGAGVTLHTVSHLHIGYEVSVT